MSAAAELQTTDYHTAGEPFRIVTDGLPDIPGRTILERRESAAAEEIDAIRRMLCYEPRGHADMYGCFLVPPDDNGAHFGVLFWHKDGYSTACGHGTIALGTWAVESGLVPAAPDGETNVVIDVPSGRVTARVRCTGGVVDSVAFRNVPSYVVARGLDIAVPSKQLEVDISYGGALYASLPACALGLRVVPEDYPQLIAAGRAVKRALRGCVETYQVPDARLSGIYGVILYDELGERGGCLRQRNVTVFADGEVDRSPCGSGTSARLALLAAEGRLRDGVLEHGSIVGTRFQGRVVEQVEIDGRLSVITEVTGSAFRTGEHRFWLDPRDPLREGFVLR